MSLRLFGKVIGCAVLALFLLTCNESNPVSTGGPEFSNLSGLGDEKIYVAYPFVDKWKKKLDTITVSFEYNSSKVKSISVKVTMDSGKSWLPVATVTPDGSNSATVRWIPKIGTAVPKYFGVKHCFMRISDSTTNTFIDSDTFPLLGATSVVLLESLDNKTFNVTDSIKVRYGVNMDLASNISTFFKTDSMTKWVEFTNSSNLPSPDEPTILNIQKCLIPIEVSDGAKTAADNFKTPIKILVQDYGPSGDKIVTGYLNIKTD